MAVKTSQTDTDHAQRAIPLNRYAHALQERDMEAADVFGKDARIDFLTPRAPVARLCLWPRRSGLKAIDVSLDVAWFALGAPDVRT